MIKDEIEKLLPIIIPCEHISWYRCDCAEEKRMYDKCLNALLTAHAEGKIILVTEELEDKLGLQFYLEEFKDLNDNVTLIHHWNNENYMSDMKTHYKGMAQSVLNFLKGAK